MKKDHIKSNLSRDIKAWRIKSGYSQQELADLVGLGVKAVGDWERHGKVPHPDTRKLLSDIFKAKVTSKGIIEHHISDMKVNNEENGPTKVDIEEWLRKQVETLIQTKGEYINVHREVWDELKEDKDKIDSARVGFQDELKEVWNLVKLFLPEKLKANDRQG